MQGLARLAPGLLTLTQYRFAEDFGHDLAAGLSIAAVALPVSVAYAELAGLSPVVGLYSSILPLVVYAIFGTSRQLMVNPDAATCAMIAAAIAPLAGHDPDLYLPLTVALTFFTGVFCIVGSFFRLGAIADFLSKPILVGFLNGVAISILLGQIGKIFGFAIESGGIIPRLFELLRKIPMTHGLTLMVGIGSLIALFVSRRFLPCVPAPLIVLAIAAAGVAVLQLDSQGVAVLGAIPAGLPQLRWPAIPAEHLASIIADAGGLALVLFTSGMLTARSFAEKGGYQVDADRELVAFGAANIASALSQGFAVTGADSRTAVGVSAGSRTQVSGLVAAATIAVALLALTEPLRYVPIAALGSILIFSALSLFDVKTLREIWKYDRLEVALSVVTTLGVVAVGAINGILVAVALALTRYIKRTARPRDEILGIVEGYAGFHSIDRHSSAKIVPGLILYRFNGPVTFFNSDYFKQRVLATADDAGTDLRWFVLDAIPIHDIDMNGLYALRDVDRALAQRGIMFILAGRRTEFLGWLKKIGLYREDLETRLFPTMNEAVEAYRRTSR
jgi:high affinity sulfate transporter 1